MHILFCNWRDMKNPEGGGSERYVESMAQGLVERGHQVTIFCAAHALAPRNEIVNGVRFIRRGSKLDVYAHAFLGILFRRFGKIDLIVDVQNGLPFFTRLATCKPVVVLVHHVHREQWPVVYPGLIGKVGWWIERWLSPSVSRLHLHRRLSGNPAGTDRSGRRPVENFDRSQWQRPRTCRHLRSIGNSTHMRCRQVGSAQAGRARHRRIGHFDAGATRVDA